MVNPETYESTMNDLSALHSGLKRVRRFRQGVRRGSALSMFLVPVLWALLVAMALDVGVDCHDYRPVSHAEIKAIMDQKQAPREQNP